MLYEVITLLAPSRATLRRLLRGLLGRLTAAPCCAALRCLFLRCRLLLLAAPSAVRLALRLALRLTAPSAALLALRLLLRLRRGCACASFARFVAVHIEDLFNFGISRVVFLRANFDKSYSFV